jgi:hypothetical protein
MGTDDFMFWTIAYQSDLSLADLQALEKCTLPVAMAAKSCRPHNDYRSSKGRLIVEEIYSSSSAMGRGSPALFHDRYGAPARTTRQWDKTWLNDHSWRQCHIERRSLGHRLFNNDEQERISVRLRNEILTPGMSFTEPPVTICGRIGL